MANCNRLRESREYPPDMISKMHSLASPQLLPDFVKIENPAVNGPRYTRHVPNFLNEDFNGTRGSGRVTKGPISR